MKEDYSNPWKTIEVKEVYENPWIKLTHRDVINPSGNPGIYGVVHFKNLAIGVIPLDDQMNTWLVGQYRYPLDKYTWEIPEGGGPIGTSPLSAAQRELMEETGIVARNWMEIGDVQVSNSVTNEVGKIFLARDLEFGEAQPEETEQLHVKKIPFQEAVRMVMDNEIQDSLSVIAILKADYLIKEGKL